MQEEFLRGIMHPSDPPTDVSHQDAGQAGGQCG